MDEFGMGSTSETSASAPTLNPWSSTHVPGGSSGGSAAAVSAQLCVAALGTDTGGSIRQPAAFCGVIGLKPTYGAVSRHGLISYCSSFDTIGTIASTVEDAAYIYDAIRSPFELTQNNYDASLRKSKQHKRELPLLSSLNSLPLIGRRFAVISEAIEQGVSPGIKDSFIQSVIEIENLGGSIDLISCKSFCLGLPAYYVIALSEASSNLARLDGVRYGGLNMLDNLARNLKDVRGSSFGEEVRRRILMGTYMLSSGYSDDYYNRAKKECMT
jgi:aspartyl-tRNA(Asn)/glutamyl-tRNA(Gln) amidotransferase subunit A